MSAADQPAGGPATDRRGSGTHGRGSGTDGGAGTGGQGGGPGGDVEDFRREVRSWLAATAPVKGSPEDFSDAHVERATGLAEYEAALAATMRRVTAWQRTLDEAGFGALGWPESYGGRSEAFRKVFAEEQAAVGVTTRPLAVGIEMVGPTLIAHGTDEQRARYLGPLRRGDEVWCQLFSEPEAGSDLPSLRTRAEKVDGGWRLNGQKVWTSGASVSDLGLALARTDPDQPRHAGISAFVVPMRAPGVEVRPLRQLSGAYHFNEVWLTDVIVDEGALVGPVGGGWKVSSTMLASERAALGGGTSSGTPEELIDLARHAGLTGDPRVRQELSIRFGRAMVLRWTMQRAAAGDREGARLGSLVKLLYSDHARRMTDTALGLLGPAATTGGGDHAGGSEPTDGPAAGPAGLWQDRFYFAPGLRIAGGSDEIQRNVIAERVLGLPREPR